jgi:hypothetical protein
MWMTIAESLFRQTGKGVIYSIISGFAVNLNPNSIKPQHNSESVLVTYLIEGVKTDGSKHLFHKVINKRQNDVNALKKEFYGI